MERFRSQNSSFGGGGGGRSSLSLAENLNTLRLEKRDAVLLAILRFLVEQRRQNLHYGDGPATTVEARAAGSEERVVVES